MRSGAMKRRVRTCAALALALGWIGALAAPGAYGETIDLIAIERLDAVAMPSAAVPPGALGVVNGGAFAEGAPTPAAWGGVLAAAGWKVVNVAAADLAGGLAPIRALAVGGAVTIVSANLDGVGAPHSVRKIGDVTVAITGVAAVGPGVALPPGVTAHPPAEALRTLIPQLKKRAALVVVLAAMSREAAVELARTVKGIDVIVASTRGSVDPAPLRVGRTTIVEAPAGGALWGHAKLERSTPGTPWQVAHRFREPIGGEESADVRAKRATAGLPGDVWEAARAPTKAPSKPVPTAASRPTGRSRALALTVHGVRRADRYGSLAARKGRALCVVDLEVENVLPIALVGKLQLPIAVLLQDLARHLYLVVDGRRLGRLVPEAQGLPGHLPVRPLKLERFGARLRANAVFDVPAGPSKRLELRLYEYAHGHITLVLQDGAAPAETTLHAAENEVMRAAVTGVKRMKTWEGQTAPPSKSFLVVAFRAESRFALEVDATAYDPQAKPGTKIAAGAVVDWPDAYDFVQVVADGEVPFHPLAESGLGPAPRFLPDLPTGDSLAFLVPENAKTLELVCAYPNARVSTGKILHPTSLRFPLLGKPKAEAPLPLAAKGESQAQVKVVSHRTPAEIGRAAPPARSRWFVARIAFEDRAKAGWPLKPWKDLTLRVRDRGGKATTARVHKATRLLPHGAESKLRVLARTRRVVEVAFAVPAATVGIDVRFRGQTFSKIRVTPAPSATETPAASKPPDGTKPVAGTKPAAGTKPVAGTKPAAGTKPTAGTKPATGTKPPPTPTAAAVRKPPPPARGLAGVGLTAEQVNRAIDRGADFLIEQLGGKVKSQKHLVAVLAILHAGRLDEASPLGQAALRFAYGYKLGHVGSSTYGAGVIAMVLASLDRRRHRARIQDCVQFLVDIQSKNGGFGYGTSAKVRVPSRELSSSTGIFVRGGRPIAGLAPPLQPVQLVRRTAADITSESGDLSCTQFAVLGLWAGQLAGLQPPAGTVTKLGAYLRGLQRADGGFGYSGGRAYGSMTYAGAASLALCGEVLSGTSDPADRARLEQASAWIGREFAVDKNPRSRSWQYYAIYGLERAGAFLETEHFGQKEWYPLGARYLIGAQHGDGSWVSKDRKEPLLDTAFAVLFLRRATAELAAGEVPRRGGDGRVKTRVPGGGLVYVILDCSASMNQWREGREKGKAAREALVALTRALRPGTRFALRVYGHRYSIADRRADRDTELLLKPGPVERSGVVRVVSGLRNRGKTPIAAALEATAKDLKREKGPVSVVLLTDGRATDALGRAVRAAQAIARRSGVHVHAVGFDLATDRIANRQLSAIVKAGKGRLVRAPRARQLRDRLQVAVGIGGAYVLLSAHGKVAASGRIGTSCRVPEGRYTFEAVFDEQRMRKTIYVNGGGTTTVTISP